jgi:sacsin
MLNYLTWPVQVYHWTDGPSIYSEDRLLIQDPHTYWNNEGGSYYLTTEDPNDPDDSGCSHAKSQLEAFQSFLFDSSLPYGGTIIRIPLRTESQAKKTKIGRKDKAVDIAEIEDFLREFAEEISDAGLLFLKNIMKVTIRIDDKVISETEILDIEGLVTKGRRDLLHQIKHRSEIDLGFEVEIRHRNSHNETNLCRYAVQHELRPSTADIPSAAWAAQDKLFPWVAVAAPLSPGSNLNSPKPLFSTLRIQLSVDQPVYLHGLWAITPDRDHLIPTAEAVEWNNYLFGELTVSAWLKLLQSRSHLSPSVELFAFWPRQVTSKSDPTHIIHNRLVDTAIRDELPIWNTCSGCLSIDDVFCAEDSVGQDVHAPLLSAVGMPVAYLPGDLLHRVEYICPDLRFRTPSYAALYLISCTALDSATAETLTGLLEYCLDSGEYDILASIPFWPTVQGQFIRINELTFLPRDMKEQELFSPARSQNTIDMSKLSSSALSKLQGSLPAIMGAMSLRPRNIADLGNDWPILYPLPECQSDYPVLGRPEDLESVLFETWGWLSKRAGELGDSDLRLAIHELPGALYLLPLQCGRIRLLDGGWRDHAALLHTSQAPGGDLLQALADSNSELVDLLDTELLGQEGATFLRRCLSTSRKFQLGSTDDLMDVLNFLGCLRDPIQALSVDDKKALLGYVAEVAKKYDNPSESPSIRRILQSLPFYSLVSDRVGGQDGETKR